MMARCSNWFPKTVRPVTAVTSSNSSNSAVTVTPVTPALVHTCLVTQENVVRRVKGHRLFSGRVYKGKYSTLRSALKIIGHVAAHELRRHQRFESYGPWPHAYAANGQPNPP